MQSPSLNSYASGTPVTDGKTIYVSFLETGKQKIPAPNVGNKRLITPGRMVVAAYSSAGKKLWMVRPGDFVSAHGFCSSPVIYEDLLIVNGDHDGKSYMLALDRKTGKTVWKVDRDIDYGSDNGDVMKAYGTPIVIEVNGELQLISPAAKATLAYNPNTGTALWKLRYPQHSVAIRPMFRGGLLYLNTGFSPAQLLAIRPDGRGDITGTHVAWSVRRRVPSMPSQLLVGDVIYICLLYTSPSPRD